MREAGVNLVSVGIFSWALLEPEPGRLRLRLARPRSSTCSGRTGSPSTWRRRPRRRRRGSSARIRRSCPITRDGVRLEFGSRRHYCPSSPVFREATVRIVEQLARRYGSHPALAMWHVSNEYGCHMPACYCAGLGRRTSARWLRDALRRDRGAEPARGERPSGASATATGRRSSRRGGRRRPSTRPRRSTGRGSRRMPCSRATRRSGRCSTELAPGIPVTTNFMNTFQPVRLLGVGRPRGRGHARLVSRSRRPRRARVGGAELRPDALARRRTGRGSCSSTRRAPSTGGR